MEIQHFFDRATSTLTYLIHDAKTGVVIDPVLDYDPKSARTSVWSAEAVAKYIDEQESCNPLRDRYPRACGPPDRYAFLQETIWSAHGDRKPGRRSTADLSRDLQSGL